MKNSPYIAPNIARLMAPADRRKYGVQTPEEQAHTINLLLEREVHSHFSGWLNRHGFAMPYHSDPARRPTILAGLPDYGIHRDGRILFIEIKIHPNKLSETQESAFARMGTQGDVILVCYSLEEACRVTAQFFNLP